jgi:hypothetical protein
MNEMSTKDLTNELASREGVKLISVEPYQDIYIKAGQREISITGPAKVIVNID